MWLLIEEGALDSQFNAAYFSQALKATNSGIPWVGFLFQIIKHLMTMVWSHGDK